MTKFLLVIFMSLSLLSGCKSIENQQDQIHLSNKETSHTVSMESENSYLENSQYNYTSLNEYSDEIGNGTTLTIPELKLTKDSLAITFE
ncbi:MAG: hypothetical protein ABS896_09980, partial [Carnobacterium inhibens]|uniref:hypothetical protein n=1 Tax=Carnobacterium inhibens TaxID=147709 RepID=UPI0033146B9E